MSREHPTHAIVSFIINALIIILLVFLVNVLAIFSPSNFTSNLVSFLNSNILLLLAISFLFFLGRFFYGFGLPINLITPVVEALGSVFLVAFIINLVELLDKYVDTGVGSVLSSLSSIIYFIVFVLVVIFGYLFILQRHQTKVEHKIRSKK